MLRKIFSFIALKHGWPSALAYIRCLHDLLIALSETPDTADWRAVTIHAQIGGKDNTNTVCFSYKLFTRKTGKFFVCETLIQTPLTADELKTDLTEAIDITAEAREFFDLKGMI